MSAASDLDSTGWSSLIDLLLSEQQSLPAVETFARRHQNGELSSESGAYVDPIGIEVAGLQPGQQLAFQVDLDSCTGCKACVTACHSMNGLAEEETWRDVGLVVGVDGEEGFQQTVTTACHHCEDPACLKGCPVLAYEKDPVTGIVRHLDDQCIGCQYCVMKCPYDVPKYNAKLGIVRKCDMCADRLAVGESPACVQGCPNGAISIQIVDTAKGGGAIDLVAGLKGALPDSSYTRPTTRYLSKRRATGLEPVGLDRLVMGQSHDPLAVMLVLLQLSVGTLGFGRVATQLGMMDESAMDLGLALAASTGILGLIAATLHLGRPIYAFRAFLGWRTSWMSREIIAVGLYVPTLIMAALAATFEPSFRSSTTSDWLIWVQWAALFVGVVGIGCSMMIYIDTRRHAWASSRTVPLFLGTLLALGALGAALAIVASAVLTGRAGVGPAIPLLVLGLVALGVKWRLEEAHVEDTDVDANRSRALERGRQLLRGPLRPRARVRLVFAACGAVGAALSISLLAFGWPGFPGLLLLMMGGSLLLCTIGEIVERHLYFTAEASPGMPSH